MAAPTMFFSMDPEISSALRTTLRTDTTTVQIFQNKDRDISASKTSTDTKVISLMTAMSSVLVKGLRQAPGHVSRATFDQQQEAVLMRDR